MESQYHSEIYHPVMADDNLVMTVIDHRRARLAQLIEQYGSQAEFVRQTGENQGEISALLKNKSFGEKKARKLEEKLKLPAGWLDEAPTSDKNVLTDGRASVNIRPILEWDHDQELGEEYVLIPRLEVKASAGNGRIVWHIDEKGQRQAFRKAWLMRLGLDAEHAATIVAEGSSMEPRVIDGDSLVVNYKATELVDGKVYVLAYQNEVYVKRLFKRPGGGLSIRSDNPDKTRYPDVDISAEESGHVQIIARVVGVSGAM